jgi:hypothetical protein
MHRMTEIAAICMESGHILRRGALALLAFGINRFALVDFG